MSKRAKTWGLKKVWNSACAALKSKRLESKGKKATSSPTRVEFCTRTEEKKTWNCMFPKGRVTGGDREVGQKNWTWDMASITSVKTGGVAPGEEQEIPRTKSLI